MTQLPAKAIQQICIQQDNYGWNIFMIALTYVEPNKQTSYSMINKLMHTINSIHNPKIKQDTLQTIFTQQNDHQATVMFLAYQTKDLAIVGKMQYFLEKNLGTDHKLAQKIQKQINNHFIPWYIKSTQKNNSIHNI